MQALTRSGADRCSAIPQVHGYEVLTKRLIFAAGRSGAPTYCRCPETLNRKIAVPAAM